ncbi:MAG: HupE/UreJ family protein [Planctomycetales bacterium]
MPLRLALRFTICLFALGTLPARTVTGHDFTFTETLVILKSDGTYQIDMTVDVDAMALGVSSSQDSKIVTDALRGMTPDRLQAAREHAANTIQRRVRVRFDGVEQKSLLDVDFPRERSSFQEEGAEPSVFGTVARLSGRIPSGAEEFTFGASKTFMQLHLTVLDQRTATGIKYVLALSQDCPPYRLSGEESQANYALDAWIVYLVLGFQHIIPKGLDHILFVLGLFLLSAKLRPLLSQVTAFTIAHTITLALSVHGVIALPSRLTESLIALSIAYVAIENIYTTELKPWRPVVVFAFGLLHGLGFAGVLGELGLPRQDFLQALIGFNIGVELGQLSVVLLAFLIVGRIEDDSWYRKAVVIPLSAFIAAVGLYWTFQRAFFVA